MKEANSEMGLVALAIEFWRLWPKFMSGRLLNSRSIRQPKGIAQLRYALGRLKNILEDEGN